MTNDHEPNIGWVLTPPALAATGGISSDAKLLLGKIIGLIGNGGYCWATNGFFAKGFSWSERKVQHVMEELERKKFIKRVLLQENTVRHIYLTDATKALQLLGGVKSDVPHVKSDVQTTHISEKSANANSTDNGVGGFPTTTTPIGNEQTLEKHNLSTAIVYPWDEIADYFDPVHNGKRSSMTAEQGRSKEGLYPCTYEEVWELAKELRLSIEEVTTTHQTLIESINEGNKYRVISVFATLRRWLKKDLESGRLQPMDDVQMISMDGRYKPENVFKRAFRYAK